MMSKADKLPLETEPVSRDNNTILTLKPGDQTLSRLTQLIIVVSGHWHNTRKGLGDMGTSGETWCFCWIPEGQKGLVQTTSLVFLPFCPEKIMQILLLKIGFSLFLQLLVTVTLRIFLVVLYACVHPTNSVLFAGHNRPPDRVQ